MAWLALRYVLVAATGLVLLVAVGLLLAQGERGEVTTNLRRLGTNDTDDEILTEVENKTVDSQGTGHPFLGANGAAATRDEDVELLKPAEPQATEPGTAVNETRTEASVDSGQACLCVFDIDRTLTGKQSVTGSRCPGNTVIGGVSDPAYGGGTLTLSRLGGAGAGATFCGGCYVGIVSTGNGGGGGEKGTLVSRLGGRVLSSSWSSRGNIHSPFVTGVPEGTKQQVVHGIVSWFASRHVQIASSEVYMFDDKASNVAPFAGSGFNAHQVSCGSRDGDVGLCGATPGEISSAHGISFCR